MTAYIKYGSFSFDPASGYPVPSVSLTQEHQRDSAGREIGSTISISLEGKIFSGSGDAGFSHLIMLESGLRKVFSLDGGILDIGCVDTHVPPGQPTTYISALSFSGIKVSRYSANKTDNNWTATIDYNIDLSTEIPSSGLPGIYVTNTQDDWNIETIEDFAFSPNSRDMRLLGFNSSLSFPQGKNYPFYRVSRTLGAVGKFIPPTGSGAYALTGSLTAVGNAKAWVNFHLQRSPVYSGVVQGLNLYNFVRSISTSEIEGSYRITDNWIGIPTGVLKSGLYTESFSIESALDASLMRTVTINGTVKGLEAFNSGIIYDSGANASTYLSGQLSGSLTRLYNNSQISGSTKFDNAMSGYANIRNLIYDRARSLMATGLSTSNTGWGSGLSFYSGYGYSRDGYFLKQGENDLNPIPVSSTEGYNPTEGTITYSWSFNNRPLNIITGSISETLTIEDSLPTQIVGSIYVLGRKLGPVLQDIGTVTSYSRSVTFEVIFPRPSSLRNMVFPGEAYKSITGVIDSLDPAKLYTNGIRSFVKTNNENWNVVEGRFTKTKAWEYTRCMY